jgi:IclR family transcriptional regulator, pca regulon regulatory protein
MELRMDMIAKPRRRAGRPAKALDAQDRGENDKHLRSTVQSLAKGFRVLEAFTSEQDEMTLSEIAVIAELDPGTTYRMLNTLVDLGYVSRLPESRRFSLTLKTLDLGFHAIARKDMRSLVRPVLRSLVGEVSEAASFAVLDGADVLYIERVRAGVTRLGVDIRVGTTVPAAQSAIGQTILAFLLPEELEQVLATEPRTRISLREGAVQTELPAILAEIRKNGYALMDSLFSDGLRVLAVPVLDPDRHPIGAISIAAPSVRCTIDDLRERALPPLRAAAADIARGLEAGGSIGFSL